MVSTEVELVPWSERYGEVWCSEDVTGSWTLTPVGLVLDHLLVPSQGRRETGVVSGVVGSIGVWSRMVRPGRT